MLLSSSYEGGGPPVASAGHEGNTWQPSASTKQNWIISCTSYVVNYMIQKIGTNSEQILQKIIRPYFRSTYLFILTMFRRSSEACSEDLRKKSSDRFWSMHIVRKICSYDLYDLLKYVVGTIFWSMLFGRSAEVCSDYLQTNFRTMYLISITVQYTGLVFQTICWRIFRRSSDVGWEGTGC